MRAFAKVLLAVTLSFCVHTVASALTIDSKPIRRDATFKETPLGTIRFEGGVVASASDDNFGGLSALDYWPDGDAFVTATDRGWFLAFQPTFDSDGLLDGVNVKDWHETKIDKKALKNRGAATDTESIAVDRDGSLLIAFEREHRVQRHANLTAKPKTLTVPIALRRPAPLGFGIEAMSFLTKGKYKHHLFAVTEKVKRQNGLRAYLFSRSKGWQLMVYENEDEWMPSAATTLANGDVLMVERRRVLFGFRARLMLIGHEQFKPKARLKPELVTDFGFSSLGGDNIEGIHSFVDDAGTSLFMTVSDDNFNGFQSTRFLLFSYGSK